MLPVDMKAVGEPFEDVEQMLTKLGAKTAAESFIKARDLFNSNPDKEDEAERPKTMTAQEWRDVLEEDDGEEGLYLAEEEEADGLLDFEDGEEELDFEDLNDGEEGEDEGEDAGEDAEPAKK